MPIYEYRCSRCGCELEVLQKITDAPLAACPSCREAALVKKVSAAGFQLKGSGWYATDFRSSGSKPAKPEAKPSEGAKEGDAAKPAEAPASSGESAGETKSAAGGSGKSCACD